MSRPAPSRRALPHYLYKGKCRPLADFDAGLLAGRPLQYKTSVHGPVIGTATVGGKPYALARKRSTFGRDALNLAALKDMTEGKASTPRRFYRAANQFGFTFNWAYASRRGTANFSSGRLPSVRGASTAACRPWARAATSGTASCRRASIRTR